MCNGKRFVQGFSSAPIIPLRNIDFALIAQPVSLAAPVVDFARNRQCVCSALNGSINLPKPVMGITQVAKDECFKAAIPIFAGNSKCSLVIIFRLFHLTEIKPCTTEIE